MSADKPIPDEAQCLAELIIDKCEGCGCDECLDEVGRIIAAALKAREELVAFKADKLATFCFDRCNERFNEGDQGSAIIERLQGKALQDFATAIRNGD